jgi:hypothetical protein
MQTGAAAAALVAMAGSTSAFMAGLQRTDGAAVAMAPIAAAANHHQHPAAPAAELPGVPVGRVGGEHRVDGRLLATADNLRAELVSATRLTC